MMASPLYRQDWEDCKSCRIPTAPKKPAAMIHERRASAKRTHADHSRRESLMSSSSQEPRASGKFAAMFSSRIQESGNQFKEFCFQNADPSNLGRSLLEGNKDHLLNQARFELMKQEHQVGSQWLYQWASATSLCSNIGTTRRTTRIYWISTRTSSSTRRTILKEEVLQDTQIRSMHEMGEMEECPRITSWRSLSAKIRRKPWNNTKAHFSVAGNARASKDWFMRISRSGIKLHITKRTRISSTRQQWTMTIFAGDDKQDRGTIPMPTFARRPSTMNSLVPLEFPQNSTDGQQRL